MEEIVTPEYISQPVEKNPFFNDKRKITFIYIPLVLAANVILGFIVGSRNPLVPILDIVAGVTVNILTLAWCKIDARERNYRLSKHFPLFVVLLGFLSLIYYLLRSRGIGQGLVAIGWLVLYAITLFVSLIFVTLLVVIPLVITGLVPKTVFN